MMGYFSYKFFLTAVYSGHFRLGIRAPIGWNFSGLLGYFVTV